MYILCTHVNVSQWLSSALNHAYTSRIDGERKRQGRLRLRVARGQSRGQNASSDTYIYIEKSRQLYD